MRSIGYFGVLALALYGTAYAQAPQNETSAEVLKNDVPASEGIRIENGAEFRLIVHGTWQQPENQLGYASDIQKMNRGSNM